MGDLLVESESRPYSPAAVRVKLDLVRRCAWRSRTVGPGDGSFESSG